MSTSQKLFLEYVQSLRKERRYWNRLAKDDSNRYAIGKVSALNFAIEQANIYRSYMRG